MYAEIALGIVLREMRAIGRGWRSDWSDFDGRTLRDQLDSLAAWAERAIQTEGQIEEYKEGSVFEETNSPLSFYKERYGEEGKL